MLNVLCEAGCKKPIIHLKDIEQIKTGIIGMPQYHYRGVVVRAPSESYLLGERPTRRVLVDERKNALSKEIREIDYRNIITSNEKSIKEAFLHHYRP